MFCLLTLSQTCGVVLLTNTVPEPICWFSSKQVSEVQMAIEKSFQSKHSVCNSSIVSFVFLRGTELGVLPVTDFFQPNGNETQSKLVEGQTEFN